MNRTKNSVYKENESKSRSKLLEQYVGKNKKKTCIEKEKDTK